MFKTTLAEFKNREMYVKGDFRLANEFKRQNPRKIMKMWAEKEMLNLKRMRKFGIPCPEVRSVHLQSPYSQSPDNHFTHYLTTNLFSYSNVAITSQLCGSHVAVPDIWSRQSDDHNVNSWIIILLCDKHDYGM